MIKSVTVMVYSTTILQKDFNSDALGIQQNAIQVLVYHSICFCFIQSFFQGGL